MGQELSETGIFYFASRWRLDGGVFTYGGILPDGTNGGEWGVDGNASGVLNVTPPVGSDCSNPIVVDVLPYNTSDDTANYGDNYSSSNCSNNYMTGNEAIYSFTPAIDGNYKFLLSDLSLSWSGIHVLDGCLDDSPSCVGFEGNSGSSDRELNLDLLGETTYYVVVSTYANPQAVGYTLDISLNECPQPVGLTVTNVTSDSAELTWDAVSNAADGYEYFLSSDGTVPDASTEATGLINAGDTSLLLTDLAPETEYSIYLRSVCDATNSEVSDWSDEFLFLTSVEPVIVSSGEAQNEAYCYDNDDFKQWLFESFDGSPLVIEFLQGSVEVNSFGGTYDDLVIYDGQDVTGTVLFNSDLDEATAADLTDLTLTAQSGFMYITLDSDSSVSCVDSGFSDPLTQIQFEVSLQTVGTTQFDADNFSFFPNPVNNELKLMTRSQVDKVIIYNIIGQKVMIETPNDVSPKLNVERLGSGTYIMSVTIEGVSKSFKLLKE